jgi:Kef-type K+ transport system membrane component KefB
VFLIGIVSTMVYSGKPPDLASLAVLSAKVIIFLVALLLVASKLIEIIYDKLMGGRSKITLTVTLIITFLFAIIASILGLHEVIGAYIAGLIIGKWGEHIGPMLKRRIAWEKLKADINTPLRAIFGPLFFGFIGLSIIFPSIEKAPNLIPLIVIILVLAIAGKVIGCGVGAKIFKFSNEESLALGCAMCGRGALELVLLSFGHEAELIDGTLFTAMVMVTIMTVIITPIIYTIAERRIES